MIKYIDLPSFKALGECGMMSHLYQWMETENELDLDRKTILVRAYDVAPILWVGKIHSNSTPKKIINCPNYEVDATKLKEVLPTMKRIASFKEFIKGHEYEHEFKGFEEETNE